MDNKVANVLNFWKICELGDIDRFMLDSDHSPVPISKFDFKNVRPLDKKIISSLKHPKAAFTTVFYGLIETKTVIKIFQDRLNDDDRFKDFEVEELNSGEFTYVAKFYVNPPHDSFSLDNVVVHINPIFYILKNLKNDELLNNKSFDDYLKQQNLDFIDKYPYDIKSKYIIIPDYNYLTNLTKYNNILEPILNISSNKVYLRNDILAKLRNNPQATNFINQIDAYIAAENNSNLIVFESDLSLEQYAIQIAQDNPRDFIYFCQNNFKLDDKQQYPINFTANGFFNKFKLEHSFSKITQDQMLGFLDDLADHLGVLSELKDKELYIKKIDIKDLKDAYGIVDTNLMSFYIDALSEAPSEMSKKFILGIDNKEKKDVNDSLSIRKKINELDVFKAAPARWASKFSPNYAQQAAINLFLKNYNQEENLFSVNGPPGTGKTTLLKDIIANIVVKRAKACIDLKFNIFKEPGSNTIKEELVGKYEIFVVSNNNKAVENISLELPQIKSMDFAYINKVKEDFLLSSVVDNFYGFKAWGLISARLGNAKNISDFKASLDVLKNFDTPHKNINSLLQDLGKKFKLLSEQIQTQETIFKKVVDVANGKIQNEIDLIVSKKEQLQQKVEHNQAIINDLRQKITSSKVKFEILKERIELLKSKMSLKDRFMKFIFKQLNEEISDTALELNELKEFLYNSENSKHICEQKIKAKLLEIEELTTQLTIKQKQLDQDLNLLKVINYRLPNDEYFSQDERDIQLNSIFNDPSYLKNKAELFFVSLQILEAISIKNFAKLKNNIDYYFTNRLAKGLSGKEKEDVENGFCSIFFITPVVSSSLAASYNMLKNVSKLGTLLCDESGQATPQSLVGVLNRAKNALIVGDPLQVEPVFTAPISLIRKFQDVFKLDDIYNPQCSSAQKLADLANKYGSYYGETWVGMPLVVHRRCINPMFDISNKISYEDKMVLPEDVQADAKLENLPESCWIDVVSTANDFPNNGNSSTKEQEAFQQFFEKYEHDLADNTYVISPFKTIKSLEFKGIDKDKQLGTIHTFQGKEAAVVFFLIGGNVKRKAKDWVVSKPNILNVAVTRAKQRIYIIGDYDECKGLPYFQDVTKMLKRKKIYDL